MRPHELSRHHAIPMMLGIESTQEYKEETDTLVLEQGYCIPEAPK